MPRYNDTIMEHFRNPRNVGEFEDAHGVGLESNPICGDTTKIWLYIEDAAISDIRFKTRGCAAAIATSSICTERVKGMPLEVAKVVTAQEVAGWAGGLPRAKVHCSVLVADALRKAIADYEDQRRLG